MSIPTTCTYYYQISFVYNTFTSFLLIWCFSWGPSKCVLCGFPRRFPRCFPRSFPWGLPRGREHLLLGSRDRGSSRVAGVFGFMVQLLDRSQCVHLNSLHLFVILTVNKTKIGGIGNSFRSVWD